MGTIEPWRTPFGSAQHAQANHPPPGHGKSIVKGLFSATVPIRLVLNQTHVDPSPVPHGFARLGLALAKRYAFHYAPNQHMQKRCLLVGFAACCAADQKRCLLVGFAACCAAISALAELPKHLSPENLRRVQVLDVVLESATTVAPDLLKDPHAAAYVEVKGVIGGNIRFELLLPEAWNERFVMGGGGGFVGTVQNSARDSVKRGYATVGTDTGHECQPVYSASWALDNLEAQVNFGY